MLVVQSGCLGVSYVGLRFSDQNNEVSQVLGLPSIERPENMRCERPSIDRMQAEHPENSSLATRMSLDPYSIMHDDAEARLEVLKSSRSCISSEARLTLENLRRS